MSVHCVLKIVDVVLALNKSRVLSVACFNFKSKVPNLSRLPPKG